LSFRLHRRFQQHSGGDQARRDPRFEGPPGTTGPHMVNAFSNNGIDRFSLQKNVTQTGDGHSCGVAFSQVPHQSFPPL
jgi:hypothetical protein